MAKKVIYNGEDVRQYGCSSPDEVLEKGKEYKVSSEIYVENSTYYALEGVIGVYSSKCFELVAKPTFFALASKVPEKGKWMKNYERFKNGCWEELLESPEVIRVCQLGIDTYEAETEENILIVQII